MFSKILEGMIALLKKNVQVDLGIIFYVFLETFKKYLTTNFIKLFRNGMDSFDKAVVNYSF
ncbi:hypothetical protein BZG01_15060 [Labilibaculum manganireducens]|uniref:Uncharacterized protein n=1 Tax=Labilibaculum manganireducens TaxID=1940525 RepID=A0A2N3I1C5_9BACT|nr:hypothetical protein [Labilibaculum manganireducens]PKQ64100.1 hypothetical protein BZG01_15060 [Labilibaculum manganireducens]